MQPVPDVMLDLETMGTRPGFAIVAIGATKSDGAKIIDTFYRRVNLTSCIRAGLKIDPDTVLWWLKQGEAARREICGEGVPLSKALEDFAVWYGSEALPIWGNGATLDNAMLQAAYDLAGYQTPWGYREERCYRTLKGQYPHIEFPKDETKTYHHALHDAELQAMHLMQIQAFQRAVMSNVVKAQSYESLAGIILRSRDFGDGKLDAGELAPFLVPAVPTPQPNLG